MFCKNCGHKLEDDAKFCSNCGTKVTTVKMIEPEIEEVKEPEVEEKEVQQPEVEEVKDQEAEEKEVQQPEVEEVKEPETEVPEVEKSEAVSEWYYVENNDSKGSFTLDEMKAKIESKEIKKSTLVWKASMTDWAKLEDTELSEFLVDEAEAKVWYYVENNDSKGPFSSTEMNGFLMSGILNNDSFIWKEGMADWSRLRNTELCTNEVPAPRVEPVSHNAAHSMPNNVKEKSIGLCIVLSIVTCGIYCLYWLYCLAIDLNDLCDSQNQEKGSDAGLVIVLSIVTCGIYQLYFMYKAGKMLASLTRSNGTHPSDDSVILLVLSIFGLPLISYCIIQSNINDFAKN